MPFSEKIKLEVKHRSMFRCCRCFEIGIQVHHIIPEAEEGPNTIENAAPLCPKCHVDFGGNPDKRKEIREMRDYWYEKVSDQLSGNDLRFQSIERKLDELLNVAKSPPEVPMDEIKLALREYFDLYLEGMNSQNAQKAVSAVVNIEKPPFEPGSPCEMAGQPCPAQSCPDGIMDVDQSQDGVVCNKCGLFIGAVPPPGLSR